MATRHAWIVPAFALAIGACGPDVVVHEDVEEGELTRLAFDRDRVQTLAGHVSAVDVQQRIGRSHAGVRVLLEVEDETYYVYLAPQAWFDEVDLELRSGEPMIVEGSVLQGDGRRVVIAQAIVVGSARYVLRDSEGRPKWRDWRSSRDWR
jgi:hypothetical protein